MINKQDITYVCKLTSEITDAEMNDFINIFNKVFEHNADKIWFDWKYTDNIYGDSYIVLAYHKDKAIGARAFWRNDIDDNLSYQPCDTAVLKEFRGMGIFTKMTLIALENTKGAFIYNYPNENSRPGYLKLGWNINKCFYLKPVLNKSKLKNESKYIEGDYLVWKFGKSPINKYFYYKKNGESYLLYNREKNIYYILGRFNDKYNDYFTRVESPILFNYTDHKGAINKVFKNKATVVSFNNGIKNESKIDIHISKADYF